jgi:hypothetical protein
VWNEISYEDYITFTNGLANVWLKFIKAGNDNCHLKERYAYDVTDSFTPAEYLRNIRYVGTGCGAGAAPFST